MKKNIHILPTDKPSRLGYLTKKGKEVYKDLRLFNRLMPIILDGENINIYITSNEEIKEGDWCYQPELPNLLEVCKNREENWMLERRFKKIILTTDQSLDGVQDIPDEFLEWFVKNPSCEEVLVTNLYGDFNPIQYFYEIIIPKEELSKDEIDKFFVDMICNSKEEPKEETTLEEFSEREATEFYERGTVDWNKFRQLIEVGAKWQQEKDKDFYFKYIKSEMDFQKPRIEKLGISTTNQIFEQQVTSLIHLAERSEEETIWALLLCSNKKFKNSLEVNEWFEQFKKK